MPHRAQPELRVVQPCPVQPRCKAEQPCPVEPQCQAEQRCQVLRQCKVVQCPVVQCRPVVLPELEPRHLWEPPVFREVAQQHRILRGDSQAQQLR